MGALCEGSFGHSRQCLIYIEQLVVDLDNAEAPEPLGMFVDDARAAGSSLKI